MEAIQFDSYFELLLAIVCGIGKQHFILITWNTSMNYRFANNSEKLIAGIPVFGKPESGLHS